MNITLPPPLRATPTGEKDRGDGERIAFVRNQRWNAQDMALLQWQRSVEKNVRMLAGNQWSVYNTTLGRWLDTRQFLSDEEKRWRQQPVVNLELQWFMLTHARLTENPPIIGFLPGPDRIDADLAATMDILFKSLWRSVGMPDIVDRLYSWLIPCGSAYLSTRLNPNGGPMETWQGAADVPMMDEETGEPMLDQETGEPMTQFAPEGVPFDAQGQPLAQYRGGQMQMLGQPHQQPRGELLVDTLSPLEVRGEWGPTPWHQKLWHCSRHFLDPEIVFERFGAEVEPTISPATAFDDRGSLERVLFGSGWFGATDNEPGSKGTSVRPTGQQLCDIHCYWERPTRGFPQGRYLVVSPNTVLYDGPRPVDFKYTSPLRRFEFVRLPGRPNATTPQETMNGPQEAFNRGLAQMLEHRALVTNPKALVDQGSGLGSVKITNRPGENLKVNRRQGVPPFEWVVPPPLGSDVYVIQKQLADLIRQLGWIEGGTGQPPGEDPSGELVKELRFNADRFAGPTQRRAVEEFGRLAEDWMKVLPLVWPNESIINVAGDDNVARTLTVLPMMFDPAHVNVSPDAESMLPEGRGERQARVWMMFQQGVFGDPLSPQAKTQFLELANFPHLSRVAKPGGIDRTMAEQENGQLMQGMPWQQVPVFDWYDDATHLMVHENTMKSPEFLKLPPEIQANFAQHRAVHQMAMQEKMLQQAEQMASVQARVQEILPQPEPAQGGGGKPKSAKPPAETQKPAGSATPQQPASVS